ncbi:hypothetical protein UFOVP1339_39 [uncultured Caudovirales phage]|uniref:Uncharacterized protein n=1 Tax=uncultured Caudovirales phage TaxID=2100421 RepID=A0A6J5RSI0_9CAUD|nr:hypothetical protein UFOVP1339_39 [uncultured Caudovirales phage]
MSRSCPNYQSAKVGAIVELLRQSRRTTQASPTQFQSMLQAMLVLKLPFEEMRTIAIELDAVHWDGEPRDPTCREYCPWLEE